MIIAQSDNVLTAPDLVRVFVRGGGFKLLLTVTMASEVDRPLPQALYCSFFLICLCYIKFASF